jgi:hypothetical protein
MEMQQAAGAQCEALKTIKSAQKCTSRPSTASSQQKGPCSLLPGEKHGLVAVSSCTKHP